MVDTFRVCSVSLFALCVACAQPTGARVAATASHAAAAGVIEPMFACSGAPAGLVGASVYEVGQITFFGPARPQPGQPLYLVQEVDVEPGQAAPTATVQLSVNAAAPQEIPMVQWCSEGGGAVEILGALLGSFPNGTALNATVALSDGMTFDNLGAGFALQVGDLPPLSWIGATEPAYPLPALGPPGTPVTEVPVDPGFVVGNNPLTILTQTYPERAATQVTLHWANADYSASGSTPMALVADGVGTFGNNDQFSATLSATALPGGQTVHYWIDAQDGSGDTLYDSQGGANYTLVPRQLAVSWAGNLGAYDAQGGPSFYQVGQLFNADLSTTIGCVENGPDDYWVQAIQVYVPGLSDQGYTGQLAQVATSLIQADLWTNLQPSGWGPIALTCQAGSGNNDVCNLMLDVFPEGGSCLPNGVTMPAGEYQYKLRFSVDDGTTWYWVGTADGSGGGSNLSVDYDPACPFASNDASSCGS